MMILRSESVVYRLCLAFTSELISAMIAVEIGDRANAAHNGTARGKSMKTERYGAGDCVCSNAKDTEQSS